MKWWNNWKDEKWFPYTVATCSAVALYFILSKVSILWSLISFIFGIISPIILGVIFAYIMDPIARFIEGIIGKKNKTHSEIRRNISVIITAIVVLVIFGLLITAVIPPLFTSASGLVNKINESMNNIDEHFTRFSSGFIGKRFSLRSIDEMLKSLVTKITSGENEGINSILQSSYEFGSGFVSVILGYILAIYFMMEKVRLQKMISKLMVRMLKKSHYDSFVEFCYKCDKILLRYLAADILEAIIVGVSNAIFMAICGLPYIALISVIVGITNLAPTFGPIFGALVGSILLLLINPWYALWFLIFTAIIQTIDGYILKPKFFGDTLGVSPLLILITIIIGGRLFGAIGIILSIPFAAIVQCFIKDYVLKTDESADESTDNHADDIMDDNVI